LKLRTIKRPRQFVLAKDREVVVTFFHEPGLLSFIKNRF